MHNTTAMTFSRILVETDGAVARITLNRPAVHNAFDDMLISELTEAVGQAGDNGAVRAIVLAGAGASFCAGADLNWMSRMADYSRVENIADARNLQAMLAAIYDCPKVTIARVHGAAMGGGAGLVAACDIAVASDQAKFAFSEVRLGIAPAVIAPYVLQKIGSGAARALFVTGDRFDAESALRVGLVQQVSSSDQLDSDIDDLIDSICKSGPNAIARTKELLRSIEGKTPAQAAEETIACIADLRVGAEGQEGIRAFLEKRKPGFSL